MSRKSHSSKTPTQADVARAAGVSQTTVSYVLSHSQTVSIPDETRQRVWDTIRELGYEPNRAAQSLRTQKTYTIAVIIEDITNPFHPAFERGIQDVAERYGYDVITYNTDGDPLKERKAIQAARRSRVDGVVGSFYSIQEDDLLPLLEQATPTVWLTGQRPAQVSPRTLDVVYVDNEEAAHTAVSYLLRKGHRRIAMLAGYGPPRNDRKNGYRRALADYGITVDEEWIQGEAFSVEEGKRAMHHLLSSDLRPTAIFAASDLLGMGAMITIREAGLRIPEDIAVVGFDNIFAAELVSPPLTTIDQHQKQLGQRCSDMLFERILGTYSGEGRIVEMPYELRVRESA
jgi:LacI family transcriptional regulator